MEAVKVEIGSSITLIVKNETDSNEWNSHRCKIIDRDNKYVYIDYPINNKTNKTMQLSTNDYITISFVKKGIVYEFHSIVEKRINLTVPALAILLPEAEEIKRIQRRDFVRVKSDVDIAVHFSDGSTPPLVSVTQDISGGGASVVIPPNTKPLFQKQPITVYLILHSITVPYEYIKIDAEIVRFHTNNDIHSMSLKFFFNSDRNQQKIINYCFDKQREKRKLGLI